MFTSEIFTKFEFNNFITRKIAHIFCGILTALLPYFLSFNGIIIVAITLTAFVGISKYIRIFDGVEGRYEVSWGTFAFPLGFGLAAFIFRNENEVIFTGAALILGFADSLGALFGKYLGKKKLPNSSKTYLGTLVFAIVMFLICFGVYYFQVAYFEGINLVRILILLVGSLIVAAIEAISKYGSDNLLIPSVAGFVIFLVV